MINEAAAQRLRLKDPVNQLIRFEYTKNALRIVGVVKNAIIGSPFYTAMPALYVYNPAWGGAILYRLKPRRKYARKRLIKSERYLINIILPILSLTILPTWRIIRPFNWSHWWVCWQEYLPGWQFLFHASGYLAWQLTCGRTA